MSSYCKSNSQNCYYGCCDYYGYCPSYSSDCYYYYKNSSYSWTAGAIIGLIIGIVCFIGFIVLVVYLCRRCRQRSQPVYYPPQPTGTEVIVMNPQQQQQPYPYGQPQNGPGYLQNPQGGQQNPYGYNPNGQVY